MRYKSLINRGYAVACTDRFKKISSVAMLVVWGAVILHYSDRIAALAKQSMGFYIS